MVIFHGELLNNQMVLLFWSLSFVCQIILWKFQHLSTQNNIPISPLLVKFSLQLVVFITMVSMNSHR